MKLFNDTLPLPPMPAAPATPREPAAPSVDTARKGRPPVALADARLPDFAKWMTENNRAVMTVGSYSAAVSAILRRGVPADAPETDLLALDLTPASQALYVRAWRNWLRFTGVLATVDALAAIRRAAAGLCSTAKGRNKPTLVDLRAAKWRSMRLLTLDGVQHFSLADGKAEWLWVASDTRLAHLRVLLEAAHGGPLPEDDAGYERALDALSTMPVFQ
jgi:hypothetical protein